MCGILAVLPVYDEPGSAPLEEAEPLLTSLRTALNLAPTLPAGDASAVAAGFGTLNKVLERVVEDFSTAAAGRLLAIDDTLWSQADEAAAAIEDRLRAADSWLDTGVASWNADDVERVQAALRRSLDLAWTLGEDRIHAAARVRHLAAGTNSMPGLPTAGPTPELSVTAAVAYFALDTVLDAIDRLEVRGRDSAGVHLWVQLSDADLAALPPSVFQRHDGLFRSGTIVPVPGGLSIVYKTASVVGRLGDNIRTLRAEISADADLRAVLSRPSARVSVLAHTRWASVGRVSTANAHPLNSSVRGGGTTRRYAVAALNGDIDNHLDLREREEITPDAEITTDAKLIPVMIAHRLAAIGTSGAAGANGAAGTSGAAALADCLRQYDGSMAIGLQSDEEPDRLVLGVKGGGQGLFVGLGPSGYVIASEVFGLAARSDQYLRVDRVEGDAAARTGTVVTVDRGGRGTLAGLHRLDAAGVPQPILPSELRTAELTTRDVARGSYERYLEKELAEAPSSFRKTLRGRVHELDRRLSVDLPDSALPSHVRKALADGQLEEIILIGQGTAAVSAAGVAHIVESLVGDRLTVRALPASELSAWRLRRDMSRTVVVAISQSGTTTDTNRTVDLVRERGATVLAIVNRRDSDLVGKSDGVLYTSDGRDIEMAVASTKAFYAQAAAGMLLGLGIAKELGVLDQHAEDAQLRMLVEMPGKLEEIARDKARIAAVAQQVACTYPYWAVVGSGPNRIAAAEVRIKLSELCYRGVSADAVEDKKHIDLSAESLILVCAAGAPVTQLQDLAKEIDIFAAHRNRPVVIADAGTRQLWPTDLVLEVPATHPTLAWLLSTAAGHLFSYYAARTIDAAADDLRAALAALDAELPPVPGLAGGVGGVGSVDSAGSAGLAGQVGVRTEGGRHPATVPLGRFVDDATRGQYRGVLTNDKALRLASARWYLDGLLPIDALLTATSGLPGQDDPDDLVRQVLTDAVEELTRSIDSVKHQAKTVTVGTSRSGVDLFENPLTRRVLELGVDRDALSYPTLLALRGYSGVIGEVSGATRYTIAASTAGPQIRVSYKSGLAASLRSRADTETALSGTKKLAIDTRSVRLERGRIDRRMVLLIPELSGARVAGLTLLHVELVPQAGANALLAALEHAGSRLPELRAAITEHDRPFDPDALAGLPTEVALLAPVDEVASAVIA